MLCSFLCNGVIFGIINSYGVIFSHLKNEIYKDDPDASSKASLVGSLAMGTTFLLSPVSSILVDKFGVRRVAFAGGFIAFMGMFLSSFVVDQVVKINLSTVLPTVHNLVLELIVLRRWVRFFFC